MSAHATTATQPAETATVAASETVEIELPTEVLDLLGSRDALPDRFRQAVILHLLREAEISQGKAARLLGITRWDILDLMARYQIPSGPQTAEEMRQDIENARRYTRAFPSDARDQQQ